MSDELTRWADNQRAVARSLGISIEDWLSALDEAGHRTAGLTAAVIGAAMARGLGTRVLDGLDGPTLAKRARALLDPRPPRVDNPVLKEAIRRATEVEPGAGLARLRARREAVRAPRRGEGALGPSARSATPDAPGDDS